MKFFLLSFILLLSSCSSVDVNIPTTPEYAPKNYQPIGVVKYSNQGADFLISKRKEDAFQKMHNNCNGNYKILSEGPKLEGSFYSSYTPGSIIETTSEYWYITYKCEK